MTAKSFPKLMVYGKPQIQEAQKFKQDKPVGYTWSCIQASKSTVNPKQVPRQGRPSEKGRGAGCAPQQPSKPFPQLCCSLLGPKATHPLMETSTQEFVRTAPWAKTSRKFFVTKSSVRSVQKASPQARGLNPSREHLPLVPVTQTFLLPQVRWQCHLQGTLRHETAGGTEP